MTIGIDKINFFVPPYYIDMTDLAEARATDPAKYHIGIGQDQMAVTPVSQDIITYAANAAKDILTAEDLEKIELVIVGTESSVDESKAAAVVLHRLLHIQPFARAFEIKEACYGATAGLQIARDFVAAHPDSKVLVVAADIAKYGLNSGGEPTQGAGAVAMLVSSAPKILAFDNDNVMFTEDVYDFWRPTHHDYPLVDGKLSNATYIAAFQKVWAEHHRRTGLNLADYAALAFHIPYTKMGKKALQSVLDETDDATQARLLAEYENSIVYSRRVGNLYTGSLYLGLISLLENSTTLSAGQKIGLFSYGSGAVAEFFSGTLVEGYADALTREAHVNLLDSRTQLSIAEYEKLFAEIIEPNTDYDFSDTLSFSLKEIRNNIRHYND